MKYLTEKVDYQLYESLFIDKDLEETKKLWVQICKNPVFLRESIEIDAIANSPILSFRGPTICFMMLQYPESVPNEIYKKLVDLIIRRRDIVDNIWMYDNYISFLALLLENKDLKMTDYQRARIMDRVAGDFGFEENTTYVVYSDLLEMESPNVAHFAAGDLYISVSEYEYESFLNGEVKKTGAARKYRDQGDYRIRIMGNNNFTDIEKRSVLELIDADEMEFKAFMKGLIIQLVGNDRDMTIEKLSMISVDELQSLYGDNPDVLEGLLIIKIVIEKHYRREKITLKRMN